MKKLNTVQSLLTLSLLFLLAACNNPGNLQNTGNSKEDAAFLSSWNDGNAKQAIMDFVKETTDSNSANFIPENERIVVFDNDGTLWSDQPVYSQFLFIMDRVKQLVREHPDWAETQPYKDALAGDMDGVIKSGVGALLTLTMVSHADMTTTEFDPIVREWIDTARHSGTGRLLKDMVYQPMLEVLDYLRANQFKTYIVSGGGIDFMRPWTEEVYGIPPEQVIGSSLKSRFEINNEVPEIIKLPEMEYFNDKEAKPVAINKFIGRRPVAAFGNSDGDLQMLQWTAAGEGKRLMVYVHHTDSAREWAYDRDSHIGKLNKGLDEARDKGWVIVDMQEDWKEIYPE